MSTPIAAGAAVAATIAAAALGAYATLVEPRALRRVVVREAVPYLGRPVRLALVTDLHLHTRARDGLRRLARAGVWTRDFEAQAILLGGDVVEVDDEADLIARRLRVAFGDTPIVAVLGNHETHEADWPLSFGVRAHVNDVGRICDAFGRAGIALIDDRETVVAADIPVLGLAWQRQVGPTGAAREILVAGGPWPIALTHSPDQLVGLDPARVGLALCGHTHGGQVRLPILGTPITHTRTRLAAASGRTRVAGVETYISRGFGQTVPLRFRSPPEVVLLDLRPASDADAPRSPDRPRLPSRGWTGAPSRTRSPTTSVGAAGATTPTGSTSGAPGTARRRSASTSRARTRPRGRATS